jgi:hypothetical protein
MLHLFAALAEKERARHAAWWGLVRQVRQQRARALSVAPRHCCTKLRRPSIWKCSRAHVAKMSLLFQLVFGKNTPRPRLSKNRQAPARAVWFCAEESDVENGTLGPT